MYRIIYFSFFIFNFSSCNVTKNSLGLTSEELHNERLNLKNTAFCYCFDKSDTSYFQLNDYSSAGFGQRSHYDISAEIALKPFVLNYVENNLKGYRSITTGAKLTQMFCLDFYNSKMLDSFVKEQDSKLYYKLIIKNRGSKGNK